jgi:hypothetical protein
MTNQEMKLLHERMKKEDPKLLVLMEKCFDAGVLSGKEPAQRTWIGLTDEEEVELWESTDSDWELMKRVEAKLKEKNNG